MLFASQGTVSPVSSSPRSRRTSGFTTLYSWTKKADIEDGERPGATAVQSAELRGAKKRIKNPPTRSRSPAAGHGLLLLGPSTGKMSSPIVRDLAADGIPVTVTCRVLKICRQPYCRWLKSPSRRRTGRGLPRQHPVRRPSRRPRVRVPVPS